MSYPVPRPVASRARRGLLSLLAPLALGSGAQAQTYQAQVQRTAYGIPHIQAPDLAGLGYGVGYTYAQDNLCLFADQILTVRGERSKFLGPEGRTVVAFQPVTNLDSDVFFKAVIEPGRLERGYQDQPETLALLRGYAAGYNRFLRDTPVSAWPAECRGAAWVRSVSVGDMMRLLEEKAIQASAGALLSAVSNTRPPQAGSAVPGVDLAAFNARHRLSELPMGSNGWAFGADATENGRGLLLGNPHFPWQTTNRFYELHLTVPGQLDVMGASLGGMPIVNIGFNGDVAWTHTVSTDKRFTLDALPLVPGDALSYVKDGVARKFGRRTVVVEVRTPAGPRLHTRTLYFTPGGPLVSVPQAGLNWTPQFAFALRDGNRNNTRMVATWLGFAKANSVQGVRAALDEQGIPWVNTIAADRAGNALYDDISTSPNVSAAQQQACTPAPFAPLFAAAGLTVLDGSRSACDWALDPASKVPGLRAPANSPQLIRRDYVANSNNSAWLANPQAPITTLDPIVGEVNAPQSPRTRMGLLEIGARLGGTDGLAGNKFGLDNVREVLMRNSNLTGRMFADDALRLCQENPSVTGPGGAVDLAPACAALAAWDRRSDLESVGAHFWREFWRRARAIPDVYAVPFDPADPVNTPRGLKTTEPAVRTALLGAMAEAVTALQAAGVAPGAALGTVQGVERGGTFLPLPGGSEFEGVLNKLEFALEPGGYRNVVGTSSSYIQAVTFGDSGPQAQAILTYSQSTDPASPHFADQTRLFSRGEWVRLPFTPAEVAAAATGEVLRLSE